MVPFFVGSKGGKCAAFSFSTPIQTFPWGKAWSLRAEAPKGACDSRGILLFGRRWILGHVLGALLRAAAGWRLAAGSVYGAFICVAATAAFSVIWCRCGGVFLPLAALQCLWVGLCLRALAATAAFSVI